MLFRVIGSDEGPDRLVEVRRPFAILGRSEAIDITISDRSVSARHIYFHLDTRGVFAVDLLTRTGFRINHANTMTGWLQPGDSVEVGNHRIELVWARVDGIDITGSRTAEDLLAEASLNHLYTLTLSPNRAAESPWVLGSELVFLGWSASCGIQIKDASLDQAHCALVRSRTGAFIVDLCGEKTKVEGRQVRGAKALRNGDRITLGLTEFTVRIEPPARPYPRNLPARIENIPPVLNPVALSAESQSVLFSWMLGTVQEGQGEAQRRQGEFQAEVMQALRQIQQDNATLLNAHLSRIEKIDRELAALRAEIGSRRTDDDLPPRVAPSLPAATPLKIAAQIARDPEPAGSRASTTWLLGRVHQLEKENRSAWKDLVDRLGPSRYEK